MTAKKLPPGDRPLKTLERIISKAGLGSRSEARKWIAKGRVSVNGKQVLDPDHWVDLELDQVTFDGKPIVAAEKVYLLLHKPAGYITTYRDPAGRPTVFDLLQERDRYLFTVGRLDLDTSGLLILTNDTQFTEQLTNPEYKIPKLYRVTASRLLTDAELEQLRAGVLLDDGPTRPAAASRVADESGQTVFDLTITEGRNRQVRRMVEALGATVVKLERLAIGDVRLGDLGPGKTRLLTAEEVAALQRSGSKAPEGGRDIDGETPSR